MIPVYLPELDPANMRIFRMNDCDWWLATTLEAAKADYKHQTGIDLEDIEDAREVTEEEMDRLKFIENYDGPKSGWIKRTFREELQRRITDGEAKPGCFASTEY
jgi:hypothetical protein